MIHLDNYVDLKARSGYITLCDDCVKMLQDHGLATVWNPDRSCYTGARQAAGRTLRIVP